jgi:hypothetical protein
VVSLSHACRTTRVEFMPMLFDTLTAHLYLMQIGSFLKAFYPDNSLFLPLPDCKLDLSIDWLRGQHHDTTINLLCSRTSCVSIPP